MTGGLTWHMGEVARSERTAAAGGEGCTVWLTGLSGSGKSTIAHRCEGLLVAAGRMAYTLDGDNIRYGLNRDLGFSADDRHENVRRVGEVARLMADSGLAVFAPLISPYAADRDRVRSIHLAAQIPFHEVHVATPLEVCEERDNKGLYARARAGEILDFTGISAPYEEPMAPDLRIDAGAVSLDEAVSAVMALLP